MQEQLYPEEYEYDYEEVVIKKTESRHNSTDNQKSSRQGVSRRDKERQRKQRKDRQDFYDDKWN